MRFRLRTLLVLLLFASIGSVFLRSLIVHRAIQLQPYSARSLELALGEGRPVLVSIGADWSAASLLNTDRISNEMGYWLRRDNFLALQADWTNRTPAVDGLMQDLGVTTTPAVALFFPSRKDPIVFSGETRRDTLLDVIDQNRASPKQPKKTVGAGD